MKQKKPSDPRNKAAVTFGGLLRQLREEAGLSITEEATRLEVSPTHLSRLERNEIRHPSARLLLRIVKCYGIPPENLLALTGSLLPSDLPDLVPYLRAKHLDWPDFVLTELDDYCDFLKHKYELQ